MSSSKHAHFLKHKLPEAKIYNIYSDICVPDKAYQKFYDKVESSDSEFIFQADLSRLRIEDKEDKLIVNYINNQNKPELISVDMVILANSLIPAKGSDHIIETFNIEKDEFGFISTQSFAIGSVLTSRPGIYVAGCAEGPKDIQNSIIQSEAAVANILSALEN